MCFSSGPSEAAKQGVLRQKQRQNNIADVTNRINAIFSNPARQKQNAAFGNATQGIAMDTLNRNFDNRARDLTFALARSGLTGGSAAVDEHDTLNNDYVRGVLNAITNKQNVLRSLRASDAAAQSGLLRQSSGAENIAGAGQQSISGLQNALEAQNSLIAPSMLGSLAGTAAQAYGNYQKAQGIKDAQKQFLAALGKH